MRNLHAIRPNLTEIQLAVIWYIRENKWAKSTDGIALHPDYGAMFWSDSYGGWDHWGEIRIGRGIHAAWVIAGRPIIANANLVEVKPGERIA